jgi:hypothetical protein
MLAIAPVVTEVRVVELTQVEVAEEQIKDQRTREATCARFPSKFLCHLRP